MSHEFQDPQTVKMIDFIREIGLSLKKAEIEEETFLPGIKIEGGTMLVDEAKLAYPGDLLHEAGHLAVVSPERRRELSGKIVGDPGADEMMAIAWSYAALLHLDLAPEVVFHPAGYKGGAQDIIDNFSRGRYFGVPMLAWIGLTVDGGRAKEEGLPSYPHMIKWVWD